MCVFFVCLFLIIAIISNVSEWSVSEHFLSTVCQAGSGHEGPCWTGGREWEQIFHGWCEQQLRTSGGWRRWISWWTMLRITSSRYSDNGTLCNAWCATFRSWSMELLCPHESGRIEGCWQVLHTSWNAEKLWLFHWSDCKKAQYLKYLNACSLLVSVDVKIYWTVLQHWSQLVPNMSADIWGH